MPKAAQIFFILLLPLLANSKGLSESQLSHLQTLLSSQALAPSTLQALLTSGKMDGFFSTDEILGVFAYLSQKYPKYIEATEIGKTSGGETIHAYRISTNLKSAYPKSKVLFTALHHAREVLSGNMMAKLAIEIISRILHDATDLDFFHFSDILMVPIINIDGHRLICEAFGTAEWGSVSLKRKNHNRKYCP